MPLAPFIAYKQQREKKKNMPKHMTGISKSAAKKKQRAELGAVKEVYEREKV
jgi:hypothetical protein